jgi:hypothetical protein
MGLKDDLIKAKVEGFKIQGKSEDEIDTSIGSAIEVLSELEKEAIVNFLTQCEFRVTQLNANVVLEDFSIPPQQGDVLPSVTTTGVGNAGGPVASNVTNGTNGVLTKTIDVAKDLGGLESTGYVFIGSDPDSQNEFDVDDEDGQRVFTTVKLFRDDIEDLL